MLPINTLTSHAIPFLEDNIDTDQLLPKQFLIEISRQGFGKHLLHDRRYLDQHEQEPDPRFVLNKEEYKDAAILISGKNFGCGSSREHAPWAIADFGIKVLIAKGFADIFYTNCLNNQILPIALPGDVVDMMGNRALDTPTALINIDLPSQTVSFDTHSATFDIAAHHKANLLSGVDKIGRTLQDISLIENYEAKHNVQ